MRKLLLVTLVGLFAAWSPAHSPHAAPAPPQASAGGRRIELRSESGSTIRGWLAPGRPGAGAVLLLHGIGGKASDMLGRARFLARAGFSVLAIDFRGHGDSTPARTTYGALESADARAAVEFLRATLPGERIGVIGVSMGGAAALLGPSPLPIQALVLESVYPTIDDATRDRLRVWFGRIGEALAPLVEAALLPRDGVTAADLRPIDRIREQTAPVLVLAGTHDRYTTLRESRALFARAPEPKALWEVEGAAHVDLHAFSRAEYERRVGSFLAARLEARREASGAERRSLSALRPVQAEDDPQGPGRADDRAERDGRDE